MTDNGGTNRRAGRRWLWIVAGIAAVGAVCAVVGIWHLPDRMYPGSSDGAVQARAALQGGLLTAAAALTALACAARSPGGLHFHQSSGQFQVGTSRMGCRSASVTA